MEKLELKYNSIKYHFSKNELYIRLGVWDYIEIFLERDEFEKNNSDFDMFVSNFIDLLNKRIVDKEIFKDKYAQSIINKLIENNILLSDVQINKLNTVVITDKTNLPIINSYLKLVEQDFTFFDIKNLDFINENINKLKNSKVLVLSNPISIKELESLNETFYRKKVTWTLGIADYQFIHIMTIAPQTSACFLCFEKSNSIRMNNYENYVSYKNNESKYINSGVSKNTVIQVLQYLINYGVENFNSLLGKVLSIYLPTGEFNIENLNKNTLCPLEGVCAKNISENLNLDAISTISKILNEDKG